MNEPDKLLRQLSPPAGGWARLQARRDTPPRWAQQWLPLAAGGAIALLVLGLLVPAPKLDVKWPGARVTGAGVVPLDEQRITPLPTSDPNVRFYWIEPAPATRRD